MTCVHDYVLRLGPRQESYRACARVHPDGSVLPTLLHKGELAEALGSVLSP